MALKSPIPSETSISPRKAAKSDQLGHWNDGMLEYWVWRNEIYFYLGGPHQKLKSGRHPFFRPSIPFFHHSIIPWVT
jgi:hypothetical protein